MLAQQQSQSRWTAFVERWDGRLERFRLSIDPFAEGPERRMRPWAVAALSVGLVVLALVFLFEAWLWRQLAPIVGWVVALIPWATFKTRVAAAIERLPPYPTL